jgi:hypothetical protein
MKAAEQKLTATESGSIQLIQQDVVKIEPGQPEGSRIYSMGDSG